MTTILTSISLISLLGALVIGTVGLTVRVITKEDKPNALPPEG